MELTVRNIRIMNLVLIFFLTSCEDFVEVGVPGHKIVSEIVFTNDETALSTLTGLYYELFNADFSGGWSYSITVLTDLSADILQPINPESTTYGELYQNNITPSNPPNLRLWSSAYKIIYMVNAILEGSKKSDGLSVETRNRLVGSALFIRAFTYFHLINIYGDVPLILSTDYRSNALIGMEPAESVYNQVISDLEMAVALLETEYLDGERTHVNRFAVIAFLARIHLYRQNWSEAENLSSKVISQAPVYSILEDLDQVFLANSREAIWQLSPIGRGNTSTSTNEGMVFIGTERTSVKMAESFVGSMDAHDRRSVHWIGHFTGQTGHFYFPYKYKDRSSNLNITEYSMVLRLAEQYLIRAEARAMQGKLPDAISDVDKIRIRAGLEPIADTNPEIGKDALLALIMEERKKEFFAEWGHRWLDLKRWGRAANVLGQIKPLWQNSDLLYPIPEEERMKNPNLDQNDGY